MSRTDELLFPGMTAEAIDARLQRLRIQNVAMGVLHLVQAVAVFVLNETGFTLPIAGTYLQGPPGTPAGLIEVFSFDVGLWVFLFLAISSLAHFTIASPWYFPRYAADLRRGKNTARWVEYSVSSTIMVILIAAVTGVVDIAAFIAIAGANIAMIAFGDLQERYLRPGGSLLPFWLGTGVGLAPWIAIVVYVLRIGDPDRDLSLVPGFVWVIVFALFAFYFSFGLNQWLQFKRIGKWANYFRGETTYVVLSLVAKSLLAWLVFANTLIPPD